MKWGERPRLLQKKYGNHAVTGDNWSKSVFVEESLSEFDCRIKHGSNCVNVGLEYLKVDFIFQRSRTNFVVQTLVPSVLLVFASFGSLHIPHDQVPGRMTLAITTSLTVIATMTSTLEKAPTTSYIKV